MHISFLDIPAEHRTLFRGKYAPMVTWCPDCSYVKEHPGYLSNGVFKGWADLRGEAVRIMECPFCFEDCFYHESLDGLHMILEEIEFGELVKTPSGYVEP